MEKICAFCKYLTFDSIGNDVCFRTRKPINMWKGYCMTWKQREPKKVLPQIEKIGR